MSFKIEYTIHFGTLKNNIIGNNSHRAVDIKLNDIDFKDEKVKKFTIFDYYSSQTIRSLKETFLAYFGNKYQCCLCVLFVYKYKSGIFYPLDEDETKKLSTFNTKEFYIIKKNGVCDCQLKLYNYYYNKDKFDLVVELKKLNDNLEKLKKDNESLEILNKKLGEEIKKIKKLDEDIIKKPNKFYDTIICINSIKSLKKGWEIKMSKRGLLLYEKCKNEALLRIGVIGNKNKGKSFLLSKISKTKLLSGSSIETEGLSIKYPDRKKMKDKNIILLDSAGFESPVLKNRENNNQFEEIVKKNKIEEEEENINEKEDDDNNANKDDKEPENYQIEVEDIDDKKEETEKGENIINYLFEKKEKEEMEMKKREQKENKEFKESAKDKIMTEIFLQNFIIENSDILLLVVGILSYSEQLLINKIKKESKDLEKEKLFVVHNLQTFRKAEQVEKYIKETLLNCKTFNLKRHKYIDLSSNIENEDDDNKEEKEEEEEEYDEKDLENIKDNDNIKIQKNDYDYFNLINNDENNKKKENEKKEIKKEIKKDNIKDAKEGEPSHFYEVIYYEKNKKLNIYHLILANDESEECKKYNNYTYNFIANMYNYITNIQSFDVFNEIKSGFMKISPTILINDVKDIKFNKTKDMMRNKILKLEVKDNKDIELKQCFTDEMGFSFFKTGYFEPKYNYFKPDDNILEIRLEIPGKAICKVVTFVENGLTKIKIKGSKKYDSSPKNPADNRLCTREFTDFEVIIPLPIEEYRINSVKPKMIKSEQGLFIIQYELAAEGEEEIIESNDI